MTGFLIAIVLLMFINLLNLIDTGCIGTDRHESCQYNYHYDCDSFYTGALNYQHWPFIQVSQIPAKHYYNHNQVPHQ